MKTIKIFVLIFLGMGSLSEAAPFLKVANPSLSPNTSGIILLQTTQTRTGSIAAAPLKNRYSSLIPFNKRIRRISATYSSGSSSYDYDVNKLDSEMSSGVSSMFRIGDENTNEATGQTFCLDLQPMPEVKGYFSVRVLQSKGSYNRLEYYNPVIPYTVDTEHDYSYESFESQFILGFRKNSYLGLGVSVNSIEHTTSSKTLHMVDALNGTDPSETAESHASMTYLSTMGQLSLGLTESIRIGVGFIPETSLSKNYSGESENDLKAGNGLLFQVGLGYSSEKMSSEFDVWLEEENSDSHDSKKLGYVFDFEWLSGSFSFCGQYEHVESDRLNDLNNRIIDPSSSSIFALGFSYSFYSASTALAWYQGTTTYSETEQVENTLDQYRSNSGQISAFSLSLTYDF